jgi:hypothetical protein
MFDLYIFDMGGVVSRNTNVGPEIAAYLEFDGGQMIEYAREDFRELTIGGISVREFVRRFSSKSGRTIEDDLLIRFFKPELDPDVVAIIDTLKIVYASHLMGLAKPDPAFYTHILEQENCSADRAVFIDDFPDNVEAARALGIRSLPFTGAEQLKKDLAALAKPAD